MKLIKVAKLERLTESLAKKIADDYTNEGFQVEMIPIEIRFKGHSLNAKEDEYELHIYKLVKRNKRWYTINWNQ